MRNSDAKIPSLRRLISRQRLMAQGFTIPELLVASIIAALITGAIAQVMISQLLEGRRLEAAQRLRENFSRFNYLVQIEASEADDIEAGVIPDECGNVGTDSFTLWIPKPGGQYADTSNRSPVVYSNVNGNIQRCGPRVFRNGVLQHVTGSDGSLHEENIVVPGAQITLDCVTTAPGRQISYQVNFEGSNLGTAGAERCVVAHARSVFVCNPALDTTIPCNQRVGDCDCI